MIRYLDIKDREIVSVERENAASWIHISTPYEEEELVNFAISHKIPVDFVKDPFDKDERPRQEKDDDAHLIILSCPVQNEENQNESEAIYSTEPLGIIITDTQIITVAQENNPIIQRFIDGKVKNFDPRDSKSFILKIFSQIVVSFLKSIRKLNLRRNLIEKELYNSSRNKELQQLLRIEKSLVYFVDSISGNDILLKKMYKSNDLRVDRANEEFHDKFEDIVIDNGQALNMSNLHTNILSGTMETYSTIINNNMNLFINRLTVITIVLMVPTLVASLYGMNVALPGANWEHMFYFILFLVIILVVGLIVFFRRRNIL